MTDGRCAWLDAAGWNTSDSPGNRSDVVRSRAAAAADDVDEAAGGEVLYELGGLVRELVVGAEGVWQTGVRIARDVALGDLREVGEVRAHIARAKRAVDADAERLRVAHARVERLERLSRQRAAALVRDRKRDHQRQPKTLFREDVLDGDDPRLGVERVEDRLEQDEIGTAVDEAADLLFISLAQLVEPDGAKRGIVHVGGDRQRPVRRPDRPRDVALPIRRLRGPLRTGGLCQPRSFDVQLVRNVLELVVRLRDRRAAERVRLDDVRAGREILPVDLADHVGTREDQEIVVSPQILRMILEALAAEIRFRQLVPL